MSSESAQPRSAWRDFVNRREPGALRVLALLVAVFAAEIILLAFAHAPQSLAFTALPPVITLAAIFTARWWSLPSAPAFPDPKWEIPPAARRWVWLMTAAVAILAMWPRTQRLQHGLSDAETRSREIAYCYSREDPAPLGDEKIEPVGANRLVAGNVAAQFGERVLQQGWRSETSPRERTLRGLPWAAGILSAGLMVLLAAVLGSPRAGLAAGLVAAMHPQFVQWGSELTDASLQLLSLAAAFLCLIQALRTNRWRWWTGLGAAQAVYLLGNPRGWPELLLLNAAAVAGAFQSPGALKDRFSCGLRLLAAAAIAGAVTCVPFHEIPGPPMESPWSRLLSGVPFDTEFDAGSRGASFAAMAGEAVWRKPLLYALLPLLAVAGCFFLLRQDWRTRLAGTAFVSWVALIPATGHVVPALLLLPVALVWSGVGLMRVFPGYPRLVHAPLFIAVLFVLATTPALQRTINAPHKPLREAVIAASATPGTLIAVAGSIANAPRDLRRLKKPEDLSALADAAFDKDTPLTILHTLAAGTHPDSAPIIRDLESGGRFVLSREFPAMDPGNTIRMYLYQPREQLIHLNVKPEKK